MQKGWDVGGLLQGVTTISERNNEHAGISDPSVEKKTAGDSVTTVPFPYILSILHAASHILGSVQV